VVLEARGIVKNYPGVRALQDVSLRLRAGRVLALLGENGAGKSTLMNVLAGVVVPDAGELRLDGQLVHFRSPRDAAALGISAIFQELSLSPTLSVAENVFLGREPRTRLGLIDYARMYGDTRALLARMRLPVAPEHRAGSLRVGQQQVIEIARAVSQHARALIMDEPTSALSQQEIGSLQQLILELKRDGVAIVYITHKFEELAAIADDVAVMRDGQLVAEAAFGALEHQELIRLMVGRGAAPMHHAPPARSGGREMLKAHHISLPAPAGQGDFLVRDVSLQVASGEVLGIFGLMGAGRTELLECLFGAHGARATGELLVEGEPLAGHTPLAAIRAGLALAPEDRQHDGLVLSMSVHDNAALPGIRGTVRWGWLNRKLERAAMGPVLERLRLRAATPNVAAGSLSGGNQQKVVLAKWLLTRPKILLLDEPTRGIDVNARNEIYALIDELAAQGLAVIVVSSDLPEILQLADRVVVMCEGRATAEFTRATAGAERVMQAALPRSAGATPPGTPPTASSPELSA
jgi:ABC-type sugar transport system ATPase subunit